MWREVAWRVNTHQCAIAIPAAARARGAVGTLMVAALFHPACGRIKRADLATALGAFSIGLTKAIACQRYTALALEPVVRGLIVGATLMVGSRGAEGCRGASIRAKFALMECLLAGAGRALLWGALALRG